MNSDRSHAPGATAVAFAKRSNEAVTHQLDMQRRRRFQRARELGRLSYPAPPPPSHRLDIRHWRALERTQLILAGRVDAAAITALRSAIDHAQSQGHEVSLDVGDVVAISRNSRHDLIGLAYRLALVAED